MPVIINGSTGVSGVDGSTGTPAVQGTDTNTGMWFPAADEIAFSEGGVEALRLNSSGNAIFSGTVRVGGIAADLYPLVQGTAQNSTSGTFVDFTGIPSWVRRVTVMLGGVSTNGTSVVQVQLGTSSGVETSGYLGAVGSSSGTALKSNFSNGFTLTDASSGAAAYVRHGIMFLAFLGGNTWTTSFNIGRSDASDVWYGGGSKALSGTLDRIRITTVNGTDLFDAGSINVMWEG
jgi:hypothetical protein